MASLLSKYQQTSNRGEHESGYFILNSGFFFFFLKIPMVVTSGDLGVTWEPCFLGCGQFRRERVGVTT